MPTWRSSATVRSCAACRDMPRCRISVSATWSPTRLTGFSELIGSWKIMAMSPPRTLRISRWAGCADRGPQTGSREPGEMCSGQSSSRRIARAVTLLPQPDSPTKQSTLPRCRLKETSSTMGLSPVGVTRIAVSISTCSRGFNSRDLRIPFILRVLPNSAPGATHKLSVPWDRTLKRLRMSLLVQD